jgi:hypothetical protein
VNFWASSECNAKICHFRKAILDLILTYKIIFNMIDIDKDSLFSFRGGIVTRGHRCKLFMARSVATVKHGFYCSRHVTVWNDLPATDVDFKMFANFKSFLYSLDLGKYVVRSYVYRPNLGISTLCLSVHLAMA